LVTAGLLAAGGVAEGDPLGRLQGLRSAVDPAWLQGMTVGKANDRDQEKHGKQGGLMAPVAEAVTRHLPDYWPGLWAGVVALSLAGSQMEWLYGQRSLRAPLPPPQHCLRPQWHFALSSLHSKWYYIRYSFFQLPYASPLLGAGLVLFVLGGGCVEAGFLASLGLHSALEATIGWCLTLPLRMTQGLAQGVLAAGLAPLTDLAWPGLTMLLSYALVLTGLYVSSVMVPLAQSSLGGRLSSNMGWTEASILLPLARVATPASFQAGWKGKLGLIGLVVAGYTFTHMEVSLDQVEMEPRFLAPSLARSLALATVAAAAGAFWGALKVMITTPSTGLLTSPGVYPLWVLFLHTPTLVITMPVLRAAVGEWRNPHNAWHEIPTGQMWEFLQTTAVLLVTAVHLVTACGRPFPSPKRSLTEMYSDGSRAAKYQRAMDDYKAGRQVDPADFGSEDLPEGVPTLYALYGAAGYCLVCCVCHPERVAMATASAGAALLCAHFIK